MKLLLPMKCKWKKRYLRFFLINIKEELNIISLY